jgi:hypothetical protein
MTQKITLYEHKIEPQEIEIPQGSTVREMLAIAKREAVLVKDVSQYDPQKYLEQDDKLTETHTMLYLGVDPHDA